MMNLLIIRHGEATGNTERRMQGPQAFALTPRGRYQVQCLAQHLARHLQEQPRNWPTQIYSSPLLRTRQTTEILVQGLQRQISAMADDSLGDLAPLMPIVQYVEALQEFDPGILAGLTWSEAQNAYPELCHRLETTPTWIPIPGAETLQAGRDRAQQFLQQVFHRHGNRDRIWIISHEWILQQVIASLWRSPLTWQLPMALTGVFEFAVDCDRWHFPDESDALNSCFWQIRRFNDTSHLSQSVENSGKTLGKNLGENLGENPQETQTENP